MGGKVQAGYRASDASCRGQAGQRARLFTVFKGSDWTLLGYQSHDRPSAIAGVRIVTVGAGQELVDDNVTGSTTSQWVLVHPDGYIAGIFSPRWA